VLIHVFATASRVVFYDEPRPELPECQYLGALDLTADEIQELRAMEREAAAQTTTRA
jgi:hypothetical protein